MSDDRFTDEYIMKEISAKEISAKEISAKEVSAKEVSAKEVPAKEIPETEVPEKEASVKAMTIEEMFAELSELARKLEDKSTTLEESFSLYQRGMLLLQECNVKLDTVEKKMLKLNEDGSAVEFSENIIR